MKKTKIYKKAIEAVMEHQMFTGEEKVEIVRELIDRLSCEEFCEKREAEKEAADNETD